jgi:hypothetical protein
MRLSGGFTRLCVRCILVGIARSSRARRLPNVVPALADAERMGMTGRNHQLSLKVKREAAEPGHHLNSGR